MMMISSISPSVIRQLRPRRARYRAYHHTADQQVPVAGIPFASLYTYPVMASVGGEGGDGGPPAVIPDDAAPTASAGGEAPARSRPLLTVESADVLRLIQHHLTECGLHGTARALQEESGVGAAGVHRSGLLRTWAREGRWADVLECLEGLDAERCGLKVRVLHACYVPHVFAMCAFMSLILWHVLTIHIILRY